VENGSSAVLVTVLGTERVLDRRSVELIEKGLSTHPHHHEGSWAMGRYLDSPWARPTTLADAIALVERVKESATRGARRSLEELAAAVSVPITGISLRECPELPATVEERIRDNRAQTMADSVMYRQALAAAAIARGWSIHWYDRERVVALAEAKLGGKRLQATLEGWGKALGAPWQAKHKLSATAAIAAAESFRST